MEEEIANRLSHLDKRVDKLSEKVSQCEAAQPFIKEMLERNIETNERLSETLSDVQLSMVQMNEKMDAQSHAIENMQHDLDVTVSTNEKRYAKVNNRIAEVEEAGKYDMRKALKTWFPWIVVIIGMGILIVSNFVKF